MIKNMVSFHNDKKIKEEYLSRVRAHELADEIIHGKYWENGKGCAVGCTIHSSNHRDYEKLLGIPLILAKLEDRIFEGLPNGISKKWPASFLEAIPVGVDLTNIWPKFAYWLMVDKDHGVLRFAKSEKTIKSINRVAVLYEDGIMPAAADAYADAAADADADADAAYAAYAAAYAAAAAADAAAANAADAAAAAAAAAADAAAAAAADAARQNEYIAQSEKLITLLRAP